MADQLEPMEFDDLVDLLRERMFDAEAVDDSQVHSFQELLADCSSWMPESWYRQAYEELDALGHIGIEANTFGGYAAQLSADGRAYVRAIRD